MKNNFYDKIELKNFDQVMELVESDDLKEKISFNEQNINDVKEFFDAPYKKRVTLIQSVRGAPKDLPEYVQDFLIKSKNDGKKVYVPMLHTNQDDTSGGTQICNVMRLIIEQSSTVAVDYNPYSEGSKFDFGMAMYHDKNIDLLNDNLQNELINVEECKRDKLYEFMMTKSGDIPNTRKTLNYTNNFVKDLKEAHFLLKEPLELELSYVSRGAEKPPALSEKSAVFFGMVYASRLPFTITSLSQVKKQVDLENKLGYKKSYSRVALKLNDIYDLERQNNIGDTIKD